MTRVAFTDGSAIVTGNKSYGQWHEIFPDPVLAVALLHHATTLNIRGDSYRPKARRDTGIPTPNAEANMT